MTHISGKLYHIRPTVTIQCVVKCAYNVGISPKRDKVSVGLHLNKIGTFFDPATYSIMCIRHKFCEIFYTLKETRQSKSAIKTGQSPNPTDVAGFMFQL